MSDFERFTETLGLSFRHGPAAAAYKEANDIDELHIAAGEHLALHAVSIMQTLPLPRHGSVMLTILRRANNPAWQEYWRINHEVFFSGAIYDLCLVREFFREARRWPELSTSLDQVLIMATAYMGYMLKLDAEETDILRSFGTRHLIDFQDSPTHQAEEQMKRILEVPGLDRKRMKKEEFLKETLFRGTAIEPFYFLEEYDRLTK